MITTNGTTRDSVAGTALRSLKREIQLRAPQLATHIAPHLDGPQLRLARDGKVWLLAPRAQDPQALIGGGHVLPEPAVTALRSIADSGIDFHDLIFGHEVELTAPVRALVPQLSDGPRSCPPAVARALVGPVPPDPQAARLARRMGSVAGALTRPVSRLPQSLAAAALDPVVFGVLGAGRPLRAGQPVLWVACVRWDW